MKTAFAVGLILVLVSLLGVGFAEAYSTPNTPQFSLRLVKSPYDVEPTYTRDPYSGDTVLSQAGYHAENRSIEVVITNQAFTPYVDDRNHSINLYYNVRVKGHFTEDWEWQELYSPWASNNKEGVSYTWQLSPVQSNGQYTVISCSADYPEGSQVDFQVQTLEGYFVEYWPYIMPTGGWHFNGTASAWSATQTLTLKANEATVQTTQPTQPVTTQTPTATQQPHDQNSALTPSQPNTAPEDLGRLTLEQIALVAACILIVVLLVTLLMLRRKITRLSTTSMLPEPPPPT